MVQCEMCGAETSSPKTVKVEGAELQVCADCAGFGTEVKQQSETTSSTKYSTSSSSGSSSGSSSASSSQSSGGSQSSRRPRRDMFDEMEEIVSDYDERIRQARESTGLSQKDLAQQLNEKASFIRKLERGESLPDDDIRKKLERALDISLIEDGSASDDADEWSGSGGDSGMTLGDVVKRKD